MVMKDREMKSNQDKLNRKYPFRLVKKRILKRKPNKLMTCQQLLKLLYLNKINNNNNKNLNCKRIQVNSKIDKLREKDYE